MIKSDFYLPLSTGHAVFPELCDPYPISSLPQPYQVDCVIIPILQMGNLRFRRLTSLLKGLKICKSWAFLIEQAKFTYPSYSTSEAHGRCVGALVEEGELSAALPLARSTLHQVRVDSASWGPQLSKPVLRNLPPLNLHAQAARRAGSAFEATLWQGKPLTSPGSSCWGFQVPRAGLCLACLPPFGQHGVAQPAHGVRGG